MMTRVRSAAAAVVAVMMAVFPVAPVVAQDSVVPDQVVIFVIDLSGSMNESFDDGRTKLDVAKEAFAEAFANVSPNAFIGLRVYGDQLAPRAAGARADNCATDSRLVVPISQVDTARLVDEVNQFDALGDTMIALALEEANNDIPDGALGTVVLFSDGRDECFDADLNGDPASGPSYGEDPCEVARRIAGDGIDLRIDRVETVGFGADAVAESELRCIADSTGGSYTPIETPEDAREILPELLADIGSPREAERLGGRPINGTPAQAGAPEFERLDAGSGFDGRYTDTIEMNTERWYRLPAYGPGDGTFTATVFGLPAQEGIAFDMAVYLPETDQTFFSNRGDSDAGLPRRPSASIRCPGCSISGGPNDVFWVLSLTSENASLGGTFDLEILTEGPAFGGVSTSCAEPQVCFYADQLEDRLVALAEVTAEYETTLAGTVDPQLLADREAAIEDLDRAEADLQASSALLADLRAQADAGTETTSTTLPLVLVLLGGVLGVAGFFVGRSRPDLEVAAGDTALETPLSDTVIGSVVVSDDELEHDEEPPPAEAADSTPADEPVVAADPEGEKAATDAVADPAEALEVPDAGWYPNPDQAGELRWWDGDGWTDHVQPDEGGAS